MQKIILFLLLFSSVTAFSHEDICKAVTKNNVQIKIQVGYKHSWELLIVESYAEIINDFIREIDSTEKVFIQFTEGYCLYYDDWFFLAYDDFKKFVPLDFPWGSKYDMKFINTQKGVNITIYRKYFSLKSLLQILEFGLQNKNYVIGKGNPSRWLLSEYKSETMDIIHSALQPESVSVMDSVLQSELSPLVKKYLSKKVDFCNNVSQLWRTERSIDFFLQNDFILFIDNSGVEILKLSTIESIRYDEETGCFFILNTNHSFYFMNQNLKSNKKEYEYNFLTLNENCSIITKIEYISEKSKYKLDEIHYFDEINGITQVR